MKRHYFISDNLDDLEEVEKELESRGITTLQVHVLSQNDAEVERHKLHEVVSFMKKDVVHSALIGAGIGLVAFLLVLAITHFSGVAQTAGSWAPFVFLAIVLLGFFTWEGGFRGIQEPNHLFLRFQKVLQEGKHILFVDVDDNQENMLKEVATSHPKLEAAGIGEAGPHWLMVWQQKLRDMIKALP